MAADPTIYCLEQLTDYYQFERLCHDLMTSVGYAGIEPLGGSKDKGRDALHVSRSGKTTIFAYSVRDDWRAKLIEDAKKVKRHAHSCDQLVVVTTAKFTVGQRDEAVATIRRDFGWSLEIYGLERLRVLLDVEHPEVRVRHPQIFPPAMFPHEHVKLGTVAPDHVFVSACPSDDVTARWLVKRLTAEGYRVWYERENFLGGEFYTRDVDELLEQRSACMIALYSSDSSTNVEAQRQRAIALNLSRKRNTEFLIPLSLSGDEPRNLDRLTQELTFIPFNNWADGLAQLLRRLSSIGCPRPLEDGRQIVAWHTSHSDVLLERQERIVTNCLNVKRIPQTIYELKSEMPIDTGRESSWRWEWPFRKVNPHTYLSFSLPPDELQSQPRLEVVDRHDWQAEYSVQGIRTYYLVSELLKKTLQAVCGRKGLMYCPAQDVQYFPWRLLRGNRLSYKRIDGRPASIGVAGERTFVSGAKRELYRYYVAPEFYIRRNLGSEFIALVRLKLRLSDVEGTPLPSEKIKSRRKNAARDWWNKEWLDRTIAVCHYLASDGAIIYGTKNERIIIDPRPQILTAPVAINERALPQLLRPMDIVEVEDDDYYEEADDE